MGTIVDKAPTPNPAMIRPSIMIGILIDAVCNAPPTKKIIDPKNIVLLLPSKSPTFPIANEDMNAPTSRIATIVPISAAPG